MMTYQLTELRVLGSWLATSEDIRYAVEHGTEDEAVTACSSPQATEDDLRIALRRSVVVRIGVADILGTHPERITSRLWEALVADEHPAVLAMLYPTRSEAQRLGVTDERTLRLIPHQS